MKMKMIILALMIVVGIAISGDLSKNDSAYYNRIFSGESKILAERVGS